MRISIMVSDRWRITIKQRYVQILHVREREREREGETETESETIERETIGADESITRILLNSEGRIKTQISFVSGCLSRSRSDSRACVCVSVCARGVSGPGCHARPQDLNALLCRLD